MNTSNVLSMLGGIVSVIAGVASDGTLEELSPTLMKGNQFLGRCPGRYTRQRGCRCRRAAYVGQQARQVTSPAGSSASTTTVGELANSNLQDQMGIAFDSTLDSVLGDWGKLSTLGPKITDSSNPTYYSPNQLRRTLLSKC